MNTQIITSNEGSFSRQDLSSPEEETAGSFHTPKHIYGTHTSSMYSVLTSQDSLDVYHDAFSTLHLPQKANPPFSPTATHPLSRHSRQRRRHFSSGAKLEDEWPSLVPDCSTLDEPNELTCMLQKGPLTKVLQSDLNRGQGQVSRSCHGSPFHIPRLSVSTNSLKRKSFDRISFFSSPQKQIAGLQGTMSCYVPCVEVGEIINETDEADIKEGRSATTVGSSSPLPHTNPQVESSAMNGGVVDPGKWRQNYVPCVGIGSLLETQITRVKRDCNGKIASKTPNSMKKKRRLWRKIREEFSMTNFKFNHRTPHLFVTSQWQQPAQMCCMYLAYRLFWGVYFLMWGIWSWVGFAGYDSHPGIKPYYLLYLTNWGIWLLAFDTMFQAVNVALHIKKISQDGDAKYKKMKISFKISWILSTITSTLHIFIPLVFWSTIFPHKYESVDSVTVNTHVIPGVYVMFDSMVSATPRRIFHAYLPMGLITAYGLFTDSYYLAGGVNHMGQVLLYPFLDWSKPSKCLLMGSALVLLLVPVIHVFVYFLYGIRVKLWQNLNEDNRYDQDLENLDSFMEEKV